MKIMFVIHSLKNIAGAETVFVNLANHFSRLFHHDISVVLLKAESISFSLEKNIKIYKLEKSNSPITQIINLRKTIRMERPDVVIGFVASTNILVSFSGWLERVPIILSEHTNYHKALTSSRGNLKGLLWKIFRRFTYPLASKVFILTEEDKKNYRYLEDVKVIPNPLLLSNNYLEKREKIILGVGRLHSIKGFDMLIEAFALLSNKTWKLWIAGEGEEREYLESLVNHYQLQDSVIFLGFVKDMESIYKQASIYILSSRSEGFPGGLCEAMGYGCSSIAFNCPTGPKEIITNGENGILIEANNIEKLAQKIDLLIEDEKQRLKLSTNGKKIANKLNIDCISEQWMQNIEESVKNYKRDKSV